jgi:hypothetical protein
MSTTKTPLEELMALDCDHGDLYLLNAENGAFPTHVVTFV